MEGERMMEKEREGDGIAKWMEEEEDGRGWKKCC